MNRSLLILVTQAITTRWCVIIAGSHKSHAGTWRSWKPAAEKTNIFTTLSGCKAKRSKTHSLTFSRRNQLSNRARSQRHLIGLLAVSYTQNCHFRFWRANKMKKKKMKNGTDMNEIRRGYVCKLSVCRFGAHTRTRASASSECWTTICLFSLENKRHWSASLRARSLWVVSCHGCQRGRLWLAWEWDGVRCSYKKLNLDIPNYFF